MKNLTWVYLDGFMGNVDDEYQLHENTVETGIAVQMFDDGTCAAYQWNDANQSITFGKTRRSVNLAKQDAVQMFKNRSK